MKCRGGGGAEGGGYDHNNGSSASSLNNNNNGAEEEEATVNIVEDKGEDFLMRLTLICWDDTATMMDLLPPLLARCPLPPWGLPLQLNNRTAGRKSAVASATTAAKVGIIACAMASSGTETNAMDVVAWW